MTAQDAKPTKDEASAALKHAARAAKRGDFAEAERWSRTAEKMSASAHKLFNLPDPPTNEIEMERLREDLRERLATIVESDLALQRWEMQREWWLEMVAMSTATGCPPPPPMPPRPHHWIDDLPEDLREGLERAHGA